MIFVEGSLYRIVNSGLADEHSNLCHIDSAVENVLDLMMPTKNHDIAYAYCVDSDVLHAALSQNQQHSKLCPKAPYHLIGYCADGHLFDVILFFHVPRIFVDVHFEFVIDQRFLRRPVDLVRLCRPSAATLWGKKGKKKEKINLNVLFIDKPVAD